MRKNLVLVILLGIAVLLLTSCSLLKSQNEPAVAAAVTTGSESTTSTNEPSSSVSEPASAPNTTNAAGSTTPDSTVQNSTSTAVTPVDSGITLESLKKGAQDAGFTVEDNKDMQENVQPKPVNGFNIDFKDESSQSNIPVYEFSDSADAQKYASEVNNSGYDLSIINGKFLGITGSRYGVVQNDSEKALLEKLFQTTMMVYEEPAAPPVSSDKDFAGDYTRIDPISKALDKLVNKSVLIYGKSMPMSDPKNISLISFALVQSGDLSFTSTLSEDQAKLDQIVKTWEYFGCTEVKLKHTAANDYTLSGKRAGVDAPFAIHCTYNPDKDSLLLVEKSGKVASELFEFVPLGNDRYAFQTLYERAIVGYKDGKITSLVYSQKTRTAETAYNPDTESIYPNGTGIDEAWVSKLGVDGYEQYITFDGTKLQISAVSFTGEKLKAEITVE